MNAFHRPVVHAGGAERASVAAAVTQNAIGVAEVVAVLPGDVEHFFVAIGMLLVEAVRNEADPTLRIPPRIPLLGRTLRQTCHKDLPERKASQGRWRIAS